MGFAGLGRPEKFLQSLQESGASIAGFVSFADHHPYDDQDEEYLIQQAQEKQLQLVTTRKDYMRLSQDFKKQVHVVDIELKFNDEDAVAHFIQGVIGDE